MHHWMMKVLHGQVDQWMAEVWTDRPLDDESIVWQVIG
jgi:hypothetical protein